MNNSQLCEQNTQDAPTDGYIADKMCAEHSIQNPQDAQTMRINQYLARCGVASRRGCEAFIKDGRVSINGEAICELGTKVFPDIDIVCVDGARVCLPNAHVTIMLNKPANYITTMDEQRGRACVASLVPTDKYPGLFPVGRLDRDTTGLLLFSNDGDLCQLLLHPRRHVEKTYLAYVSGVPKEKDLERLRTGIVLEGKPTKPARVELLNGEAFELAYGQFQFEEENASGFGLKGKASRGMKGTRKNGTSIVEISISEGRNRQVKKMLASIGNPVIALHRKQFGPLSLDDLPRGKWRELTENEVQMLIKAAKNV